MKILFYISLFLIAAYLGVDVFIRVEEKGERPIVQLIAGASLISMLFYNFYYSGKTLSIFKEWKFMRSWTGFIVLALFYYLFAFIGFPSDYSTHSLRNIIVPIYILVVFVFIFKSTINGHLKGWAINFLIYFLVLNGLYELFFAITNTRLRMGMEVINTSAGYIFVMILPLLMYRYKKDGFWVFIICFILTLITGKRGAVLIFGGLILYSLYNYRSTFANFRLNWKTWFFLIVILFVGIYFYETAYDSLEYRLMNIENEERGTIGSGRDVMWGNLLYYWSNASLFQNVFGLGFYSSWSTIKNVAHNDFVQFLGDYGINGLLLWLIILWRYYKNIRFIKFFNPFLFSLLLIGLFVLIGRSFVAGTWRTDQMNWAISMGYLFAIATLEKHQNYYGTN